MTAYLDTSVVVPLFVLDPHVDRVRRWAAARPSVTISDWTMVEFTSALSFQVREGRLTLTERRAAEAALDRWAASLPILEITPQRLSEARTLLRSHRSLRAPDALHLAYASAAGLSLATLDQGMARAAGEAGVELVEL